MLTTGFLTAALTFAATALSAALAGVSFELPSSFEPQLQNYEPELLLPLIQRDTGNCGSSSYYNPSVGTGACGWQNSDNELVVALPSNYFQGKCGQSITITANGKSATAKIVDLCPSCDGGHVDMSPPLFQHFAELSQGRVNTCWTYGAAVQPPVESSTAPATTQAPSVQHKQAVSTSSASYSFPPDFEPPPKGGPGAISHSIVPVPVATTSQIQAKASSPPAPLPPTSTAGASTSAAPTTRHVTITRTRTTRVPRRTSTVSVNAGAELYEAAVLETSLPLPTKDVLDGLLGAAQKIHGDGRMKNGTLTGAVSAAQGTKGWLEWTKHLQFINPFVGST